MGDFVAFLRLVRESNYDFYSLMMICVFWLIVKLAKSAGARSVSFIGEIMKQSESLRISLNDQLAQEHEANKRLRQYNSELQMLNEHLRHSVDESLMRIATLERAMQALKDEDHPEAS